MQLACLQASSHYSGSVEQLGENAPVPATHSSNQHALATAAQQNKAPPRPLVGQGSMNHHLMAAQHAAAATGLTAQQQQLAHLHHLLATSHQAMHAQQQQGVVSATLTFIKHVVHPSLL